MDDQGKYVLAGLAPKPFFSTRGLKASSATALEFYEACLFAERRLGRALERCGSLVAWTLSTTVLATPTTQGEL